MHWSTRARLLIDLIYRFIRVQHLFLTESKSKKQLVYINYTCRTIEQPVKACPRYCSCVNAQHLTKSTDILLPYIWFHVHFSIYADNEIMTLRFICLYFQFISRWTSHEVVRNWGGDEWTALTLAVDWANWSVTLPVCDWWTTKTLFSEGCWPRRYTLWRLFFCGGGATNI